jgi:hypothetical protein
MTTFVHAQYPTTHFGVERAKLGLSVAQDLAFSALQNHSEYSCYGFQLGQSRPRRTYVGKRNDRLPRHG